MASRSANAIVTVGSTRFGNALPLALIAGPCALESRDHALEMASAFATFANNGMGIAPHVIEQILNHQSGHKRGPAGIYNRSSYEREVRAALALWEDHVRTLVEGGGRKIVPMTTAAS